MKRITMIRKMLPAALLGLAVLAPGQSVADVGGGDASVAWRSDGAWIVMADTSLRDTLNGWSEQAGWTLIWDHPRDYRIRASARFSGSFEEAIVDLMDSIYSHHPDLVAKTHPNKVVRIFQEPLAGQ